MRLTYCFAICLMQIIAYAKGGVIDNAEPTFVVKVEPTSVTPFKDTDKIHVVVTATYKDGSPVNGYVYFGLSVKQDYNPNEVKIERYENIQMVNGKTEYDFNIIDASYKYQIYFNNTKHIIIAASVASDEDFEINSDTVKVTINSSSNNS